MVYNVATELAELLRENGLANVQQAVGMDVDKKWKTQRLASSTSFIENIISLYIFFFFCEMDILVKLL